MEWNTVKHFVNWLSANGCAVIRRKHNYELTAAEVEIAYSTEGRGGDQLAYLDELRSPRQNDGQYLSLESCRRLVDIQDSLTCWHCELPDEIAELLNFSLEQHARYLGYEFRRAQANAHISNQAVRQRIFDRDGWACKRCMATERLSIDHVVSVINGGDDSDGNLQTLCRRCNSSKGGR